MALNIDGTTGISGVDGSASAASIAGTDANTGLSFASDTVNINTGGSTRYSIDSSGNIQAGGANPVFTGSSLSSFKIAAPDGGSRYYFGGTGNSADAELSIYNASDSQKIRLAASASEPTFFNSGASFYINTTDGSLWNNTDAGSGWSFLSSYGAVATKTDRATGYANMYINKTNTGSGTDERWINFIWDAGDYGNVKRSGSGVNYQSNSDYRLKENIVNLTDGITRLKNLKPSRFNWKSTPNVTVDGFIAHEAQTVVPEAVDGVKDQVADDSNVDTENGKPIYQKMDNAKLVPLLTAALQEAVAKIEVLETKVAALEAG